MKTILSILFFSSVLSANELRTVGHVEISQYLGLWHEVARIPNEFQDNITEDGYGPCSATTAQYSLTKDGKIQVRNSCDRLNARGESKRDLANGVARIVKGSGNAKLKVNFTGVTLLRRLGIGDGDYWILGLGPLNDKGIYSWVLVGEPNRENGWILSRTPKLNDKTVEEILTLAELNGYSRSQFQFSPY